jgi:hypothetical protein
MWFTHLGGFSCSDLFFCNIKQISILYIFENKMALKNKGKIKMHEFLGA